MFIVLNSIKTLQCLHVIEFIELRRFQILGRVSKSSVTFYGQPRTFYRKKTSRVSLKQFYNVFIFFNFVLVSFIWNFSFYCCASTRFSAAQLLVLRRKMKLVRRIQIFFSVLLGFFVFLWVLFFCKCCFF